MKGLRVFLWWLISMTWNQRKKVRNDQLNCLHNTMLSRISINEVLTNFEKKPTSSLLSTIIFFSLVSMPPDRLCISDIQWKTFMHIYHIQCKFFVFFTWNRIYFIFSNRTREHSTKKINKWPVYRDSSNTFIPRSWFYKWKSIWYLSVVQSKIWHHYC